MSDLLTDAQHQQILAAVKVHFENPINLPAVDLPKIWGYGPVVDAKLAAKQANCVVLHDPTFSPSLPPGDKIDVTVDGNPWKITLARRGRKRFKLRFHGPYKKVTRRAVLKASASAGVVGAMASHTAAFASDAAAQTATATATTTATALTSSVPDPSNTTLICPPNASPTGPLMGGDAIYNWQNLDTTQPRNIYWGTIAYVGDTGGKIKFPGDMTEISTSGKAISCAHVLYHQTATVHIRSYHHATGITFGQTLPGWPTSWPSSPPLGKWPDIAVAAVDVSVAHNKNTVRALGVLAGVKAPKAGDIVTKYGATTGLTVARDIGMVWRRLPDEAGEMMLIRAVSNQFSRPGDSGSAVVHHGSGVGSTDYRKLAGFILAGSIDDNEQYYLPVLEFVDDPVPAELNAVQVML